MKKYENSPEDWEYPCAKTCEYCKQKVKVKTAKVIITTYQNLLYHYLLLGEHKKEKAFILQIFMPYILRPKNLLFCDEAHNIPNIVQNHFTPEFKLSQFEEIFLPIYEYCVENDLRKGALDTHNELTIVSDFYIMKIGTRAHSINLFRFWTKKCFKSYELLPILKKYHSNYFCRFKAAQHKIGDYINEKIEDNKIKFGTNKPILDPEDWAILNKLLRFEELMCKFSDVLEALESTGHKNLLKKSMSQLKRETKKIGPCIA